MRKSFCFFVIALIPTAVFAGEFNYSFPVQKEFAGVFGDGINQSLQTRDDVLLNLSRMKNVPDWSAFLMNAFCGFGVGSFAQGDRTGGTIILCGELGGILLMVGSIFVVNEENPAPGVGMLIGSLLMTTSAHIFGLIRPWLYE
jgi:hypothetical protein